MLTKHLNKFSAVASTKLVAKLWVIRRACVAVIFV